MPNATLPAYAIVELLIRLSGINKQIGDYKGHTIRNGFINVKTTGGTVKLTPDLVMQQFNAPEQIGVEQLILTASSFRQQRKP
ncbi:hypothetical protein LJ707_07960 [Mucilaginibacter sp. UR6-1]|uniref:hypothetical protein n=1 Tax=Mucilaginibacter sp. UR6-1 TaxID=1435643 RepID=UPI001E5CFB5D|nr:hypothetical protein [Mucilaginibacter sp. UR6-1]MCC8408861.1 hypothetical protein [Mucilaginibacter sp. UR6-1]